MVTIAQIAAAAVGSVSASITDAIHPATMNWTVQGAYDTSTGTYTTTPGSDAGRAIEDSVKPISDVFEAYIAGPAEVLVLLEGFTTVPQENWTITYAGRTRTIMRVQDIMAAGSLFYCVVR